MVGLLIASASCQLELNCKFERVGWDDVVQPAFTCNAQNMNLNRTNSKTKITSLNGELPPGETFDKVNTFLVFEQNCDYFPIGIDNYFKKLEGLAIQKSGLKKITKAELKPFKELKSISLYGNELTSLESRLFMYNPKLKLISLFSNKIKHIYLNVFDQLPDLDCVFITFNPCISQTAQTKEEIEVIKITMAQSCAITEEMSALALFEEENFRLVSELIKNQEILNAVTKALLRAQKQIEKFKDDFNVERSSNGSYHCVTELTFCEVEKIDLMELVKEMRTVEIVCDHGNQSRKCETLNLQVLNSQISVTNVRHKDKSAINLNEINELTIKSQHVLHLPLNISDFLPNLEKISVKDTGLIVINKQAFEGLNSLSEIDFSQNKLTEVQSTYFEHAKNLLKIDLSQNEIASISSFKNLKAIKELRLNNNLLTKVLVGFFSENKNLELLTLNSNKLSQIASNFLDFSRNNLRMVDLSDNLCIDEILDFPTDQIQLPINCSVEMEMECKFEQKGQYKCFVGNLDITSENIKNIGLKGDHVKGKTNEDVAVLRIYKQTMEFIPAGLGKVTPNLETFSVESSKLKTVVQENFIGLRNLKNLTIKDNKLTKIDASFNSLLKLEILDLSQNLIVTLDENVVNQLSHLRILNLSHNKLSNLTSALIPQKNSIEQLMCSHNNLSFIDPRIIKRLKLALVIDFESNSCIDSKYDKSTNHNKKVMEIFGEVSFKCTDAYLIVD